MICTFPHLCFSKNGLSNALVSLAVKSHDSEINFTFPLSNNFTIWSEYLLKFLLSHMRQRENTKILNIKERMKQVVFIARQGGMCNINRISYGIYLVGYCSSNFCPCVNFFLVLLGLFQIFLGIITQSPFQQKPYNHELDVFLQLSQMIFFYLLTVAMHHNCWFAFSHFFDNTVTELLYNFVWPYDSSHIFWKRKLFMIGGSISRNFIFVYLSF